MPCLVQLVDRLSGDLPVFILAEDWETTAEEIDDRFLGDAEIWQVTSLKISTVLAILG